MNRRGLLVMTVLSAVTMMSVPALAADAPEAPKAAKLLAEAIQLVGPAAAGEVPAKAILNADDKVVCIGDSITAGGGYLKYMDAVFAQQYGDLRIAKVVNAGISGHKAENLVARFQKDVLDRKPNVLTLNIGINDVWHRLKAPHDEKVLATYKENVAKMVDQAQAAGIKVILLAPTVIQENPEAEGNKRLTMYVQAMREIAADKKCGFVDLHRMFLDALKHKPADMKGNWLTGDGVHMKPLGYAVMTVAALRGMGVPDDKLAATDIPLPAPRKPKAPAKPKPAPAEPQS